MSLAETGCTLCVGDIGARTSTLGATKVNAGQPTLAPFHHLAPRTARMMWNEPRPRRLHDVAARRHVGERHLAGAVADGIREDQLPSTERNSTLTPPMANRALEDGDGRNHTAGGDRTLKGWKGPKEMAAVSERSEPPLPDSRRAKKQ